MFLRARVPVNPHLTSKNKWSICKNVAVYAAMGFGKLLHLLVNTLFCITQRLSGL